MNTTQVEKTSRWRPMTLAAGGIFAAAVLMSVAPYALADDAKPDTETAETPAQRDARMAWFREARFGLFIHWGVYSVPAGEYKDKTGLGEWFLEETHMPVSAV